MFVIGPPTTQFIVSGADREQLAERLEGALEAYAEQPRPKIRTAHSSDPFEARFRVIQMKRPDSLAHAVSFAAAAVRRGARELKSVLWDGTIVRLSVTGDQDNPVE